MNIIYPRHTVVLSKILRKINIDFFQLRAANLEFTFRGEQYILMNGSINKTTPMAYGTIHGGNYLICQSLSNSFAIEWETKEGWTFEDEEDSDLVNNTQDLQTLIRGAM